MVMVKTSEVNIGDWRRARKAVGLLKPMSVVEAIFNNRINPQSLELSSIIGAIPNHQGNSEFKSCSQLSVMSCLEEVNAI